MNLRELEKHINEKHAKARAWVLRELEIRLMMRKVQQGKEAVK